jgi:putative oxidoreductase
MRPTSSRLPSDVALLALRLIAGAVFVFHGWSKVFGDPGIEGFAGYLAGLSFPAPLASAWLAAVVELAGGLALLAGAGTRLVSVPLGLTMLVASFTAHAGGFDSGRGGMEFTLTLASVTLALAILGSGRLSIDGALERLGLAPSFAPDAKATAQRDLAVNRARS